MLGGECGGGLLGGIGGVEGSAEGGSGEGGGGDGWCGGDGGTLPIAVLFFRRSKQRHGVEDGRGVEDLSNALGGK